MAALETIAVFVALGLVSLFAAGGGHGSYLPLKLVFPFSMLSTLLTESIAGPANALAIIQVVVYAGAIADSTRQGVFTTLLKCLIGLHCFGVVLSVALLWGGYFPDVP